MLNEIPSTLLREWEYYAEQEPFGQLRSDILSGTLIQLVYNALRGKDSAPISIQDILFPKPEPPPSVEDDLAYIEALVRTGKVIDLRQKRKGG